MWAKESNRTRYASYWKGKWVQETMCSCCDLLHCFQCFCHIMALSVSSVYSWLVPEMPCKKINVRINERNSMPWVLSRFEVCMPASGKTCCWKFLIMPTSPIKAVHIEVWLRHKHCFQSVSVGLGALQLTGLHLIHSWNSTVKSRVWQMLSFLWKHNPQRLQLQSVFHFFEMVIGGWLALLLQYSARKSLNHKLFQERYTVLCDSMHWPSFKEAYVQVHVTRRYSPTAYLI